MTLDTRKRCLFVAAVAVLLMSGCGTKGTPTAVTPTPGGTESGSQSGTAVDVKVLSMRVGGALTGGLSSMVLFVELEPSSSVRAGKVYVVQLFDKGASTPRGEASVSWNQPELNVGKTKLVQFSLTGEEQSAYSGVSSDKLQPLFSVKMVEER